MSKRILTDEQMDYIKACIIDKRYDKKEKSKFINMVCDALVNSRQNKEDFEDCIEILEFIINESNWLEMR